MVLETKGLSDKIMWEKGEQWVWQYAVFDFRTVYSTLAQNNLIILDHQSCET